MGIKIFLSNNIEKLADHFALEVKNESKDFFQPDWVVHQTEGVKTWLSLYLAKNEGVFGMKKFTKPDHVVTEIARYYKNKNLHDINTEKMRWIIFTALGSTQFKALYPSVASYYEDSESKRLQLSSKVADLFDQYLVYREEYIKAWNTQSDDYVADLETVLDEINERFVADKEFDFTKKNQAVATWKERKNTAYQKTKEAWQGYLWRKVKAEKKRLGDHEVDVRDRVEIKELLLDQLKEDDGELKKQVGVIHFFGISLLTRFHVDFFYELSQVIDLKFYFLNPAPEQFWYASHAQQNIEKWKYKYQKNKNWDNLEVGNSLLTLYGKLNKDLLNQFFRADDEFLNGLELISDDSMYEMPQTLLQQIQQDIYHNNIAFETPISDAMLEDHSVVIATCYSPVREVEALYNHLIVCMTQDPSLKPTDILVMVPDMEKYAPYIRSVFDNAPYKIKYAIADQKYKDSDQLAQLLVGVLSLEDYSLTAEAVLQLLDNDLICEKFGIEDIAYIRKKVSEAYIRFGWENTQQLENETRWVSWEYGLRRMVLGMTMQTDDLIAYKGEWHAPLAGVEGKSINQLLRFIDLVQQLRGVIKASNEERTFERWAEFIDQIVQRFCIEKEDFEVFEKIRQKLSFLNEIGNEEIATMKLSKKVFFEYILQFLKSAGSDMRFLRGDLTFCTMIPMRSLPFKIIAMLGMNHGDFPRTQKTPMFNLMEDIKLPGDRQTKENDKHLFLETLLSAKDCLYLSYIGFNPKTNKHREPSLVIQDVLDYVKSRAENKALVEEALVVKHPLHSYSKQYNQEIFPKLISYLDTQEEVKYSIDQLATSTENVEENQVVKLSDLIAAFKNSVSYYFTRKIGLCTMDEEVQIDDYEVFELDKLGEYYLREHLRGRNINEVPQEEVIKAKLLKIVPLAQVGTLQIQNFFNEKQEETLAIEEMLSGYEQQEISGEIKIGERIIAVNQLQFYQHTTDPHMSKVVLFYRKYKDKDYKKQIECFFNVLALQALTGEHIQFRIILSGKPIQNEFRGNGREILQEVLEVFDAMTNQLMPVNSNLIHEMKIDNLSKWPVALQRFSSEWEKYVQHNGWYESYSEIEIYQILEKFLTPYREFYAK